MKVFELMHTKLANSFSHTGHFGEKPQFLNFHVNLALRYPTQSQISSAVLPSSTNTLPLVIVGQPGMII